MLSTKQLAILNGEVSRRGKSVISSFGQEAEISLLVDVSPLSKQARRHKGFTYRDRIDSDGARSLAFDSSSVRAEDEGSGKRKLQRVRPGPSWHHDGIFSRVMLPQMDCA